MEPTQELTESLLLSLPLEVFRLIVDTMVENENIMMFYALAEKRLVCKLFDYEICKSIATSFKYHHYRYMSDDFMLRLLMQLCKDEHAPQIELIVRVRIGVKNFMKHCSEEWVGREDEIIQAFCRIAVMGREPFIFGSGKYLKKILSSESAENYENSLYSAFVIASYLGSIASLTNLLAKGADPSDKDNYFGSPLTAAVHGDQIETVKFLLAIGTENLNAGRTCRCAFSLAALNHKNEIFGLLLQWDNEKEPQNRLLSETGGPQYLYDTISAAAEAGNLHVLELILDRVQDRSEVDLDWGEMREHFKSPALHTACLQGHEGVVRYIVNHNHYQSRDYVYGLLLPKPCRLTFNEEDTKYTSLIQLACKSGNKSMIDYLFSKSRRHVYSWGVQNSMLSYERKPGAIGTSIRHGHYHLVEFLLSPWTKSGDTDEYFYEAEKLGHAVNDAAATGQVDILKLLLDYGVPINGKAGLEAIAHALAGGHDETINLLLERFLGKTLPRSAVQDCQAMGIRKFLEHFGITLNDEAVQYLQKPPGKLITKLVPATGRGSYAYCRCGYESKHLASQSFHISFINLDAIGFQPLLSYLYTDEIFA